ncbi:dihydroxy-acid dehydratase [Haloechinothrix salitolerans]
MGPLTLTDIVRFAGAGGDFNPLHHDAETARAAGFPDVIAMGQMHAGMLGSWVADVFGVEHLRSFEVRFAAPVNVGDTLTFTGEVTEVDHAMSPALAQVTLAVNRGDDVVLHGKATVAVAS